jgi:IS30 family transposase
MATPGKRLDEGERREVRRWLLRLKSIAATAKMLGLSRKCVRKISQEAIDKVS